MQDSWKPSKLDPDSQAAYSTPMSFRTCTIKSDPGAHGCALACTNRRTNVARVAVDLGPGRRRRRGFAALGRFDIPTRNTGQRYRARRATGNTRDEPAATSARASFLDFDMWRSFRTRIRPLCRRPYFAPRALCRAATSARNEPRIIASSGLQSHGRSCRRAAPDRERLSATTSRTDYRFPVLHQMIRGSPGQRLGGQRGIARPARPHNRRPENSKVWCLVREPH